jgi:hypothetical protein
LVEELADKIGRRACAAKTTGEQYVQVDTVQMAVKQADNMRRFVQFPK